MSARVSPSRTPSGCRLLTLLADDLLDMCLSFLPADSLARCASSCRQICKRCERDELWEPIALWLPGVGMEFAVNRGAEAMPPWRSIVACWTTTWIIIAGRRIMATLREQEQEKYCSLRVAKIKWRQQCSLQSARHVASLPEADFEEHKDWAALVETACSELEDLQQQRGRLEARRVEALARNCDMPLCVKTLTRNWERRVWRSLNAANVER